MSDVEEFFDRVITVKLAEDGQAVNIIDQTLLPGTVKRINLHTKEEMWEAIKKLRVRGAPAIGVTAAYGMAVLANQIEATTFDDFYRQFKACKDYLATSRPTAVNLFWALDRMDRCCQENSDLTPYQLKQVLYEAYTAIKQADELNIYLDGEHRMLELPDFSSLGRARELLGTLSDSSMVAGYVNEMQGSAEEKGAQDTYMIRIGQEIAIEGLEDCSFITATYNLSDSVSGNIGVIGPKRMEYSKVISQIDFVKKTINENIKRLT